MDFLHKISSATQAVADKANHVLEVNRLQGKIHVEEKNIKELIEKIGTYYVAQMDAGENPRQETEEFYQAILASREKIYALQSDIQRIKTGQPQEGLRLKCGFCGAMNHPNQKFCGECGNELHPEKPCCPVCGAEWIEDLKFCVECGAKREK